MPDNGVFIFGASDHARVVIDIVELEGKYQIRGLLDTYEPKGFSVAGYTVLGAEEDLPYLVAKTGVCRGIVAIGDNWTRKRISHRLRELVPSFEFVRAVHPSSRLSRSVHLGPGAIVMAHAYIGLDTRVEEGCVIATKALFEHDGIMGAFATLGAGTITGGRTRIGECTAVCLSVTVMHGISIGDNSVIGAGATVCDDIPAHVVAYGTPARVIRDRDPSESYLHIRGAMRVAR